MNTLKLAFYYDHTHGWLAVPKALIEGLKIGHLISHYSYERCEHVYLEEDVDAAVLDKAYKERFGNEPDVVEIADGTQSEIRSYRHYVNESYDPQSAIDYLRVIPPFTLKY